MSRTARTVVAGLVTVGALAMGAGVAYADDAGDTHHDDGSKPTSSNDAGTPEKAPSTDSSEEGAGGGGLPGGDMLGGLLGSLPIGL